MRECLQRYGGGPEDTKLSFKIGAVQSDVKKFVNGLRACARARNMLKTLDLGMTLNVRGVAGAHMLLNAGQGESLEDTDDMREHQDIVSLLCYY